MRFVKRCLARLDRHRGAILRETPSNFKVAPLDAAHVPPSRMSRKNAPKLTNNALGRKDPETTRGL